MAKPYFQIQALFVPKILLILCAVIYGLDQWSKMMIEKSMYFGESQEIIDGFLYLTRIHNDGIAFGFFQGGNTVMIGIVICLVIVGLWMACREVDFRKLESQIIGGMIVAGALGNLTDRFRLGYVLDFVDVDLWFYRWPAFNVADAAISVSMVWVIVRMVLSRHKEIV